MFDLANPPNPAPPDSGGPFDVAELHELAAKAAGTEIGFYDATTLMDTAAEIESVVDLLRAASSRVLAHLHDSGATITEVGLSTGSWLAKATGQPSRACKARVRTSHQLHRHFPELGDALINGRVGWAHVELIVSASNPRIHAEMAEACPLFIAWTNDGSCRSFDQWAGHVRRAANLLDVDGGYDPHEDVHANRLRLSQLPDQTTEVKGRLVGAGAVTVESTLEAIADELFLQFSRDNALEPTVEIPTRQTLRALALIEACKRAAATPLDSTRPANVEATVIINTDSAGNVTTTTADGAPIASSAAEQLLVDPEIRRLIMDAQGCPLDLGRKVRLATAAQRAAIAARDGGCIHPGCDKPPAWTRIHHITEWQHGGRSDLANMAGGCAHHHSLWHSTGWSIEADPDRDQRWIFITPSGRRLHSQRQSEH